MSVLLFFILSIPLCLVTHEVGHWLTARFFGETLKFRFGFAWLFGVVPVPRFTWTMPRSFGYDRRVAVALSGFVLEETVALLFLLFGHPWPLLVGGAHLFLYPYYAGKDNDFKHLAT